MSEKNVPGGLSSPADTVGLTGLVPFEVIRVAAVTVRHKPGSIVMQVELPAGRRLAPGKAVTYRIHGGEAGLDMDSPGQIVRVTDAGFPLAVRYLPRVFPSPPARGELSVDLAFWHTDGAGALGQDVQWRVPIVWDRKGGNTVNLRFALSQRSSIGT